MRVLDLFAGVGGFAIASHWWGFSTKEFVEIDPYKQRVLRKHFPHVPIHSDIRTYQATENSYDLITMGFPCTGTSVAGNREGLSHSKSSLWWTAMRIVGKVRPRYVVIENPLGVKDRGLREILGALRVAGYSGQYSVIGAGRLGAGHRRQRLFIVAYLNGRGEDGTFQPARKSEVRILAKLSRFYAQWLQAYPVCDDLTHGVSWKLAIPGLTAHVNTDRIFSPDRIPNRINSRIAMGQAVTPQQAFCVLGQVKNHAIATGFCSGLDVVTQAPPEDLPPNRFSSAAEILSASN